MLHLTPFITAYSLTFTALLGLAVGSFINCMAWRLSRGESVTKGRSHCTACGHTLGAVDLVPLLSFLMLKGRCRYCGQKISPRYPAAEIISAVMFLGLVLRYDITFTALRYIVFCCLLFTAALVDLEIKEIPDRLLIAAAVWFVITLPFMPSGALPAFLDGLKGGFLIALPLLGFVLLADKVSGRETMGGGDIKLFFTVGLYLGLPLNLLNLIFSCFLGVLFGLSGRFKKASDENSPEIPFGPAIAAGTWFVLIFGGALLDWYLEKFF
jgi:leader peptidase (prepilin peptidase)/N-methyltransferase